VKTGNWDRSATSSQPALKWGLTLPLLTLYGLGRYGSAIGRRSSTGQPPGASTRSLSNRGRKRVSTSPMATSLIPNSSGAHLLPV
jgi:hypothetical protein